MGKFRALAFSWVLLLLGGLSVARAAEDDLADRYERGNWAAGVAVSTMGIGPEVMLRLHPNLVFRISGGVGDASSLVKNVNFSTGTSFTPGSFSSSDTKYAFDKFDITGARALIDWHPFRDGGRITVGGGYLDASGDAALTTTGATVRIGSNNYTAAAAKGLKFSYENDEKFLGYTGIGYDNAFFKEYGFSLSTDFGVFWGYSADVKLTGGTGISQTDRATEQSTIKGKVDQLPVYPVVSFAAKYRF
jgi:hypothetical protein